MSRIANGDLTTPNHHLFWIMEGKDADDDWVREHLREMEQDGYRIAGMASGDDGICVAMTRDT